MARNTKALLSAAVLGATCVLNVEAATDAERIAALEAQLNQQKAAMQQQQRMTESMDAGLQRLKTGEPAAVIPAGQGHRCRAQSIGAFRAGVRVRS